MDNFASACPFCLRNKLLKGVIIQETKIAFLIENTFQPGNFLIIPKNHTTDIHELPDTWWAEVRMLLDAIPELGTNYNVSLNIGELAGQTQPHLHFWVIPRTLDSVGTRKGLLGLMQLLKDKQEI